MNNDKNGYTYIMFNKRDGTLYTGVTSNLIRRVYEHKSNAVPGFSKKYNTDKLGYYEVHSNMYSAIAREKQIKDGSRKKKIALITEANPNWKDLYYDLL